MHAAPLDTALLTYTSQMEKGECQVRTSLSDESSKIRKGQALTAVSCSWLWTNSGHQELKYRLRRMRDGEQDYPTGRGTLPDDLSPQNSHDGTREPDPTR